MDDRDLEKVIKTYNRQGWYPAPWAHHPEPIKAALRHFRMRPMIKECFRNCQAFVFRNMWSGLGLDVTYCEGWVVSSIPLEHAWLEYRGEPIDLTLRPGITREILQQRKYGAKDVACGIHRGWFGPLDPEWMASASPFAGAARVVEMINRAIGGSQ